MKSALAIAVIGLVLGAASAGAAETEIEVCQSRTENVVIRGANCDLAIRLGGLSQDQMIVALFNRGQSLLAAERAEKAMADFDAVLVLKPGDKEALFGRAMSRRHLKQFDAALADLDTLAGQDYQPAAKLYLQRSMTHFMAGNKEKSLADLRHAKELAPDDPVIADRLWKTERILELESR
jgi:tetratricopeptide (TPR) repeat protein